MRVALVGAEHEENLAVRYLWGALERAGHQVVPIVFNSPDQVDDAARALVAAAAPLAGLSMVFTARARQFADVAARVRALGFRGHIVAGGHFATLHAAQLLTDVVAIDSVGCGEGEELLCELAERLEDLDSVRGLVFRRGGAVVTNPPRTKEADLDRLAVPPRKVPFDSYLGIPITNVLASRGCKYACAFCSIAAWHRVSGGDRLRLRDPARVAEEMAALHARGARIFNFHDDNFFLPRREETLARASLLDRELRRRGVSRIAFAVKSRPDTVDEELFRALRGMGLFRTFLGIEAGSRASLRQLGRRQSLEDNERALEVVNRLDIHTTYNLLLLNPDSTLRDLADNVAFLRRHPKNPANFCRTEIYAGTPLEAKLRREGRLLGDYWGLDYVIADPAAQAAWEVISTAFWDRNYRHDGLHHQAMALDWEHQLLAHFFTTSEPLRRRVKDLVVRVNLDTCDLLDLAIDGVARGVARDALAREIGAKVRERGARLEAEIAAVRDEIRGASREPARPLPPWARTAFAAGLAATVAATPACKLDRCGATHPTETVAAPPTSTGDASAPPATPSVDASAERDDDASGQAVADAAADAKGDASVRDAAVDAAKAARPAPAPGPPSPPKPRDPLPSHYNEMAPAPMGPKPPGGSPPR